MTSVVTSLPELKEIEDFLYLEASYLDRADLDNWLDLYTEDCTYWMPLDEDQDDPLNHASIMYENRDLMEIRKRNLKNQWAPSKHYKVRSTHIISNIRIQDKCGVSGDCTVTSQFLALMHYKTKHLFGGTYLHELKRVENSYRILHKRVTLIDCDAPQETIIMYL